MTPHDVLTELDERLAAVRRAEAAVGAAEAAERSARRNIDRAAGPLTAYHEQVAAGERAVDADHERELLAALHGAQQAVTLRPAFTTDPRGDGTPKMIGLDSTDLIAEAALAGARRALEGRRAELAAFVAERLDELAAARVPRSRQAGQRMAVALQTLDGADREWREESRWWAQLDRLAGDRGRSLGALPGNPAAGLPPAHERPVAPIPAGLAAGLVEAVA